MNKQAEKDIKWIKEKFVGVNYLTLMDFIKVFEILNKSHRTRLLKIMDNINKFHSQ